MAHTNNVSTSGSSTNNPTTSNRPLFIAQFNGQAAAIRRNLDYTATIASICKAFPALKLVDPSLIYLSAKLDGFEDLSLYINDDAWGEVVPGLTVVEVSVEDGAHAVAKECKPVDEVVRAVVEPPTEASVEPEPIIVRIRYKHANTQDLLLPILPTATVQQLKSFIMEHDDRLCLQMMLSCERHPTLDDCMTLDKYGIENETTVFLSTEFEVYLAGSGYRFAVSIVTFANVSVLAELLRDFARVDFSSGNTGLGYLFNCSFGQILSCAGEVLCHSRKLGSYHQLVPGCVICVNKPRVHLGPWFSSSFRISVYEPRNIDEVISLENVIIPIEDVIIHQYEAQPESTVLDLKILISNRRKIPSSLQVFEVIGGTGDLVTRHKLNDREIINECGLEDGSVIWFKGRWNPIVLGDIGTGVQRGRDVGWYIMRDLNSS